MCRRQFSLKTSVWLMAVVAAFCAGAAWQRRQLAVELQYARDLTKEGQRLLDQNGSIGVH